MRLLAIFAIMLSSVACTPSHRLILMYESDDAVRGNLQITERESTHVVQEEKKNEKVNESGIVDGLRSLLP
jgi:hypothetical protein